MQGTGTCSRLLTLSVAVIVLVIAFASSNRFTQWHMPSIRIRHHGGGRNINDLVSTRQACQPIGWERAKIGTYCVSLPYDNDPFVVNRISLDNNIMNQNKWELKTAHLWMGPKEVYNHPTNFEAVPYETIKQAQQSVYQFANVSISDHLQFDCSTPIATYFSRARVLIGEESGENPAQLEVEVAFNLHCSETSQEGLENPSIFLRPVANQSKLRKQLQNSTQSQHRKTLINLLPQVIYKDGKPSTDWLTKVFRNLQCSGNTLPEVRGASEILNEEFLKKAYISHYLSGPVCYERDLIRNLRKFQEVYDHFYAWDDDKDDVTVMAKFEDTCYAAFRATDPFNLHDGVLQNLDCCAQQIPYTNCYIRDGYYNGYFTKYAREFELKMNSCLSSCDGGPCELIFTGMSQGAGPATVASIIYEKYNPKVITYGGARALYRISPADNSVCQHINPQNHYRMVLTDKLGFIDFIPYQWAFFAEHVGHEILFDGDGFNYQGINNRVQRSPLRYQLFVHAPCNYDAKTRELYENVCFPAASHGWLDGHWCAVNQDCESDLCYQRRCFAGFDVGERCDRDEVCKSKVCNLNVEECAPISGKMELDMHCAEDEDCHSGRCDPRSWLPFSENTCQLQLQTGEACNEDSDCLFGYCGGLLWSRRCWPDDNNESPTEDGAPESPKRSLNP